MQYLSADVLTRSCLVLYLKNIVKIVGTFVNIYEFAQYFGGVDSRGQFHQGEINPPNLD